MHGRPTTAASAFTFTNKAQRLISTFLTDALQFDKYFNIQYTPVRTSLLCRDTSQNHANSW